MTMSRRNFIQSSLSAAVISALGTSASKVEAALAEAGGTTSHPLGFGWQKRNLARRPNIVVAILDDVGFGDFGCYGSELTTPCIDRIASEGVRFNNFHVTALCAPTRACLLTGRNAHAVGVGNIAEWGRDLPGYRGWIRQDAATLAEMLKPLGYSTFAIGKWHLSTIADQNATGPFDHWPIGRGFDRWFGFHGNAMDHFHPEIFENVTEVKPHKSGDYHLTEDLVDHSIRYLQDHLATAPQNPFFVYFAPGACHFPFHAPKSYIDKYRGRYDRGWDQLRAERFARQRESGVVPPTAELSQRNAEVPGWDSMSSVERATAARGQEVYAGFMEHTDAQLQRLIDFLAAEQVLNDTIVIVLSDNGAARGGQPFGTLDVRRASYLGGESFDYLADNISLLGGEDSYGMYGAGWTQVSNTPLKWYKGDTFGGGTRSPLIVRWPNGGLAAGEWRSQYHHAIDLVPTLLEMIEGSPPPQLKGTPLMPLQGKSFAYTFDHADAPTAKVLQYYETYGDRAIWADGWKAVVRHRAGDAYDRDVWELYHLDDDFCELRNLADQHPERLQALIALWRQEAEKYDVLPMSDDLLTLYQQSLPPPRERYLFYPDMARLDRLSAPDIYHHNSRITAYLTLENARANGVLLACGDGSCGYELYMQEGRLVFEYVYTREQRYRLQSSSRVTAGDRLVGLAITKIDQSSARVNMEVDGEVVASATLGKMWPIYAPNSGLRCGANHGAPISKRYRQPFAFDQQLHRVAVDVDLQS